MSLDPTHHVHTGADGRLGSTTPADLDALADALAGQPNVVLHFHGGLIDARAGRAIAERLLTEYAPAHPVFFIWESGFLETVRHSLATIVEESIFEHVLEIVTKYAVGKLRTEAGLKAAGQLDLPKDLDHRIELERARRDDDAEPYADFEPLPAEVVGEVTLAEEQALVDELRQTPDFEAEIAAILQGLEFEGADQFKAARPEVEPTTTLLSPDVLQELVEDAPDPGEKFAGLSAMRLAWRVARILGRVVDRVLRGRDHGIYVTTVEEVLRDLYLANIGASIWHAMKQETADTFDTVPGEHRGGSAFLDVLGRLAAEDALPGRITLVGHSTGAVFIDNLLIAADHARRDPAHPLPEDFRFGDVVFLAPACSFHHFAAVLEQHRDVFDDFRMFTMLDAFESRDRLVPVIYPRSLLYFVSGVVEREPGGDNAHDLPIVGMERFHHPGPSDPFGDLPGVRTVRAFVAADPRRAVWTETDPDAAPGLRGDAITHVGFDDTDPGGRRAVMDSVVHLVTTGVGV